MNNYSHIKPTTNFLVNAPRVSVVIPFYRGIDLLERTIASLTLQTYPNELWELIIVEDGSPQDTTSLVKRYHQNINIRRFRQSRQGYRLSAARNLGITKASGAVILLVDFDCICSPNHIISHITWLQSEHRLATFGLRKFIDVPNLHPNDVSQWIRTIDENEKVESISNRNQSIDRRIPYLQTIQQCAYPFNWFYGCNIGFRKHDALNIGLFDIAFDGCPGYEDIEFGYRLFQSGCYIVLVDGATVHHQENEVVGVNQREKGKDINLVKLYEKVPGIEQYRASIGLD